MTIQVPLTATLLQVFTRSDLERVKLAVFSALSQTNHRFISFELPTKNLMQGLEINLQLAGGGGTLSLMHSLHGYAAQFEDTTKNIVMPTDLATLMVEIPDDMAHLFPNAVPVPTSYTLAELVATRYRRNRNEYSPVMEAIAAKLAVMKLRMPGFDYRIDQPLVDRDWTAMCIWLCWVEDQRQCAMTWKGHLDGYTGVMGGDTMRLPNWLYHLRIKIPAHINPRTCVLSNKIT